MEEKAMIYKGAANNKGSVKDTVIPLICVAVMWSAIFLFANFLPFAWFFELGAIVLSAVLINKILNNKGTFSKTYILYDDRLVIQTRYGLIEKESSVHPISSSTFENGYIITDGRKTPFYPDEKLIEILKSKTTS